MKKRLLALAALCALAVGCAVPAFADGASKPAINYDAGKDTQVKVEVKTSEEEEEPALTPAGPDDAEDRNGYEADKVGFVSFENIERRMRKENLKIQMMDETIDTLEEMDYDAIETQLRSGLSMIEAQVLNIQQAAALEPIGAQVAITNLQAQAAELQTQLDAIKSGDLRRDNNGIISQLENGQDLLVMAGETMFLALKAMETQDTALQRQLAALNRTVEEMELRYEMGQISALQLAQVKSGRSSLISGMNTLKMNIQVYKSQLEQFLGADITGEITLGAVPSVTAAQLAAMDLEKDWKQCKRRNYDIDTALEALSEAEEAEEEAEAAGEESYEYLAARNSRQAADYTYGDTIQSCELKFRTLYAQVRDYKQVLDTAKVALECQEESFRASELRYQQGTISKNALLTAQDDLETAREAVENAANDLFSAYNTYCWAVENGVLNG